MVLGLHVGSVFMLWVLLVLYVSGAGEGDALIKDSNPGSSAFRVLPSSLPQPCHPFGVQGSLPVTP